MAARKVSIILAVLVVVGVGLTARVGLAPARAATGDSVVLAWNQQVLDTIVTTKTGPTIAARALAVVHTAIYDAWAAYDPVAVGTRLGSNLRQPAADRTLDNKNRRSASPPMPPWSTCSQPSNPSMPRRWATWAM